MDLNTYGYPVDVGLVTKCEQLLSSIKVVIDKQTIHDAVSESIEPLNDRFDEVNEHIENAKDEIIENCDGCECGCCGCCGCGKIITKTDLAEAVNTITSYMDEKFEDINQH